MELIGSTLKGLAYNKLDCSVQGGTLNRKIFEVQICPEYLAITQVRSDSKY